MSIITSFYEAKNNILMYGPVIGRNRTIKNNLSEIFPEQYNFLRYTIMNGVLEPKTYIRAGFEHNSEIILIGGKHKLTSEKTNIENLRNMLDLYDDLNDSINIDRVLLRWDNGQILSNKGTSEDTLYENIIQSITDKGIPSLLELKGNRLTIHYSDKESILEMTLLAPYDRDNPIERIKNNEIDKLEEIWSLMTNRTMKGKKGKLKIKIR